MAPLHYFNGGDMIQMQNRITYSKTTPYKAFLGCKCTRLPKTAGTLRAPRERMVKETETLSEDERRALRGSKFAPLPSLSRTSNSQPRLAHPGGPVTTNKAAALAKFLERKLKEPDGLASINPDLLEIAVNNAKRTVFASSTSNPERSVRHVDSFGDTDTEASEDEKNELSQVKEFSKRKNKKKKDKKKNKKRKKVEDPGLL